MEFCGVFFVKIALVTNVHINHHCFFIWFFFSQSRNLKRTIICFGSALEVLFPNFTFYSTHDQRVHNGGVSTVDRATISAHPNNPFQTRSPRARQRQALISLKSNQGVKILLSLVSWVILTCGLATVTNKKKDCGVGTILGCVVGTQTGTCIPTAVENQTITMVANTVLNFGVLDLTTWRLGTTGFVGTKYSLSVREVSVLIPSVGGFFVDVVISCLLWLVTTSGERERERERQREIVGNVHFFSTKKLTFARNELSFTDRFFQPWHASPGNNNAKQALARFKWFKNDDFSTKLPTGISPRVEGTVQNWTEPMQRRMYQNKTKEKKTVFCTANHESGLRYRRESDVVVKGQMSFMGCSGTPFVTSCLGGKIKPRFIPLRGKPKTVPSHFLEESIYQLSFNDLDGVSPCNAGTVCFGVFKNRRGNISVEGAWESTCMLRKRTNCAKGQRATCCKSKKRLVLPAVFLSHSRETGRFEQTGSPTINSQWALPAPAFRSHVLNHNQSKQG